MDENRPTNIKDALLRVSAGIGHEINNLVLVFDLNLDGLQDISVGTPEAHELLSLISDAADQARRLANRLLAFAGRQVLRPSPVDLNKFLMGLKRNADSTDLVFTVAPCRTTAPIIRVDAGHLSAALLELVRNAADAGSLSIDIRVEMIPGRSGVMILVADDGEGMDEAQCARAAEPFFTTKKNVAGHLGLGLSEVDGFVRQSGGILSLDSHIGVGTTAALFFPIRDSI